MGYRPPVVSADQAATLAPPESKIMRNAGIRHQVRVEGPEVGRGSYVCTVSVVSRGRYRWSVYGHLLGGEDGWVPCMEPVSGDVPTVKRGLDEIAGVVADLVQAQVMDAADPALCE